MKFRSWNAAAFAREESFALIRTRLIAAPSTLALMTNALFVGSSSYDGLIAAPIVLFGLQVLLCRSLWFGRDVLRYSAYRFGSLVWTDNVVRGLHTRSMRRNIWRGNGAASQLPLGYNSSIRFPTSGDSSLVRM
jgi:hypothetical protein